MLANWGFSSSSLLPICTNGPKRPKRTLRERAPEIAEQRFPCALAARDGVQVVFKAGGEVVINVALEVFGEEVVDDFADGGRDEAAVFLFDVFAVLQGADDAGVGGGATDAVVFEFFDVAAAG